MRILVADDESLARFSIVSVLHDLLPESLTVIEAANGTEMIEKVRQSRPHIGFADIRMPGMDGLEAIARTRNDAPRTFWVIVSGHKDFSYAQKALKLGVVDFLLKPVDPLELKELLQGLFGRIRDGQIRGNRDLEARIAGVLGNTNSPQFDPWFRRARYWQAVLILWDCTEPDDEIVERRRNFALEIQNRLDSGDERSGCIVSTPASLHLLVLATPAGGTDRNRETGRWTELIRELHGTTRRILTAREEDTWYATGVLEDPEELFREIETLSALSGYRHLHRPSDIISIDDARPQSGSVFLHEAAEILEEMKTAREMGSEEEFHGLAHRLNELTEENDLSGDFHENISRYRRCVMPLADPLPVTLKDLARRLQNESRLLVRNLPAEPETGSTSTLAHRALDVMNRRYHENIGIPQVAEELGITPNYLSTVFKKEKGASFTRTLTELRLEKSLTMLRRGAGIGETARSLGYQSSRHFTRLFKERYGLTPSQWLEETDKTD